MQADNEFTEVDNLLLSILICNLVIFRLQLFNFFGLFEENKNGVMLKVSASLQVFIRT